MGNRPILLPAHRKRTSFQVGTSKPSYERVNYVKTLQFGRAFGTLQSGVICPEVGNRAVVYFCSGIHCSTFSLH